MSTSQQSNIDSRINVDTAPYAPYPATRQQFDNNNFLGHHYENQVMRENDVVPVQYGKVKQAPKSLHKPYNLYVGGDTIETHSTMIVSAGDIDLTDNDVFMDETPIKDIASISIRIRKPEERISHDITREIHPDSEAPRQLGMLKDTLFCNIRFSKARSCISIEAYNRGFRFNGSNPLNNWYSSGQFSLESAADARMFREGDRVRISTFSPMDTLPQGLTEAQRIAQQTGSHRQAFFNAMFRQIRRRKINLGNMRVISDIRGRHSTVETGINSLYRWNTADNLQPHVGGATAGLAEDFTTDAGVYIAVCNQFASYYTIFNNTPTRGIGTITNTLLPVALPLDYLGMWRYDGVYTIRAYQENADVRRRGHSQSTPASDLPAYFLEPADTQDWPEDSTHEFRLDPTNPSVTNRTTMPNGEITAPHISQISSDLNYIEALGVHNSNLSYSNNTWLRSQLSLDTQTTVAGRMFNILPPTVDFPCNTTCCMITREEYVSRVYLTKNFTYNSYHKPNIFSRMDLLQSGIFNHIYDFDRPVPRVVIPLQYTNGFGRQNYTRLVNVIVRVCLLSHSVGESRPQILAELLFWRRGAFNANNVAQLDLPCDLGDDIQTGVQIYDADLPDGTRLTISKDLYTDIEGNEYVVNRINSDLLKRNKIGAVSIAPITGGVQVFNDYGLGALNPSTGRPPIDQPDERASFPNIDSTEFRATPVVIEDFPEGTLTARSENESTRTTILGVYTTLKGRDTDDDFSYINDATVMELIQTAPIDNVNSNRRIINVIGTRRLQCVTDNPTKRQHAECVASDMFSARYGARQPVENTVDASGRPMFAYLSDQLPFTSQTFLNVVVDRPEDFFGLLRKFMNVFRLVPQLNSSVKSFGRVRSGSVTELYSYNTDTVLSLHNEGINHNVGVILLSNEHILAGSLNFAVESFTDTQYDGAVMDFYDEEEEYDRRTLVINKFAENPYRVNSVGITNQTQAYEYLLFRYQQLTRARGVLACKTELNKFTSTMYTPILSFLEDLNHGLSASIVRVEKYDMGIICYLDRVVKMNRQEAEQIFMIFDRQDEKFPQVASNRFIYESNRYGSDDNYVTYIYGDVLDLDVWTGQLLVLNSSAVATTGFYQTADASTFHNVTRLGQRISGDTDVAEVFLAPFVAANDSRRTTNPAINLINAPSNSISRTGGRLFRFNLRHYTNASLNPNSALGTSTHNALGQVLVPVSPYIDANAPTGTTPLYRAFDCRNTVTMLRSASGGTPAIPADATHYVYSSNGGLLVGIVSYTASLFPNVDSEQIVTTVIAPFGLSGIIHPNRNNDNRYVIGLRINPVSSYSFGAFYVTSLRGGGVRVIRGFNLSTTQQYSDLRISFKLRYGRTGEAPIESDLVEYTYTGDDEITLVFRFPVGSIEPLITADNGGFIDIVAVRTADSVAPTGQLMLFDAAANRASNAPAQFYTYPTTYTGFTIQNVGRPFTYTNQNSLNQLFQCSISGSGLFKLFEMNNVVTSGLRTQPTTQGTRTLPNMELRYFNTTSNQGTIVNSRNTKNNYAFLSFNETVTLTTPVNYVSIISSESDLFNNPMKPVADDRTQALADDTFSAFIVIQFFNEIDGVELNFGTSENLIFDVNVHVRLRTGANFISFERIVLRRNNKGFINSEHILRVGTFATGESIHSIDLQMPSNLFQPERYVNRNFTFQVVDVFLNQAGAANLNNTGDLDRTYCLNANFSFLPSTEFVTGISSTALETTVGANTSIDMPMEFSFVGKLWTNDTLHDTPQTCIIQKRLTLTSGQIIGMREPINISVPIPIDVALVRTQRSSQRNMRVDVYMSAVSANETDPIRFPNILCEFTGFNVSAKMEQAIPDLYAVDGQNLTSFLLDANKRSQTNFEFDKMLVRYNSRDGLFDTDHVQDTVIVRQDNSHMLDNVDGTMSNKTRFFEVNAMYNKYKSKSNLYDQFLSRPINVMFGSLRGNAFRPYTYFLLQEIASDSMSTSVIKALKYDNSVYDNPDPYLPVTEVLDPEYRDYYRRFAGDRYYEDFNVVAASGARVRINRQMLGLLDDTTLVDAPTPAGEPIDYLPLEFRSNFTYGNTIRWFTYTRQGFGGNYQNLLVNNDGLIRAVIPMFLPNNTSSASANAYRYHSSFGRITLKLRATAITRIGVPVLTIMSKVIEVVIDTTIVGLQEYFLSFEFDTNADSFASLLPVTAHAFAIDIIDIDRRYVQDELSLPFYIQDNSQMLRHDNIELTRKNFDQPQPLGLTNARVIGLSHINITNAIRLRVTLLVSLNLSVEENLNNLVLTFLGYGYNGYNLNATDIGEQAINIPNNIIRSRVSSFKVTFLIQASKKVHLENPYYNMLLSFRHTTTDANDSRFNTILVQIPNNPKSINRSTVTGSGDRVRYSVVSSDFSLLN